MGIKEVCVVFFPSLSLFFERDGEKESAERGRERVC
jgi:hypothetical protein